MKTKNLVLLLLLMVAVTSFAGCSAKNDSATSKKITAEQAKQIIDDNKNIIILDVRTQEEYDAGHIKNAILIPDTEISAKAENILTDQSATILVYCRSGRRSAGAAKVLSELGYTNINDMGGIIDWPYEVVTE